LCLEVLAFAQEKRECLVMSRSGGIVLLRRVELLEKARVPVPKFACGLSCDGEIRLTYGRSLWCKLQEAL
jgi:hypothetical protein